LVSLRSISHKVSTRAPRRRASSGEQSWSRKSLLVCTTKWAANVAGHSFLIFLISAVLTIAFGCLLQRLGYFPERNEKLRKQLPRRMHDDNSAIAARRGIPSG